MMGLTPSLQEVFGGVRGKHISIDNVLLEVAF